MFRGSVFLTIVMLGLAGCSSNSNDCARDLDCGDRLVCIEAQCAAPPALDGGKGDAGVDAGPSDGGSADAGPVGKCTDPSDFTTCTCDVKSDCTPNDPSKAKFFVCTPRKMCMRICLSQLDCATGEVCEDSQCRPPACGEDSQCSSGQQCIGTTCAPAIQASEVASCEVLGSLVVKTGTKRDVTVLARNSAGDVIPYKGAVSWFSTSPSIAAVSGTDHSATVMGGAAEGTTSISASIGGQTCSAVAAVNFVAATTGQLRVVVIDQDSRQLLPGATVVMNDSTTLVTDASGTAAFTDPGSAVTISVFEKDHAYVTVVDTTSKDLLVAVPPNPAPLTLHGTATPRTFDKLLDLKGTVHAAFFAPAVQGNWMDFRAAAALGDTVKTHVDLGGSTASDVDMLPGMVAGLAETMFRDTYDVAVPGTGVRTLWGLGGNSVLSDILGVVSQTTGGGDIDWGAVNAAMAPVSERHVSGVLRGHHFTEGETLSLTNRLGVLKRTRITLKVPTIPSVYIDDSTTLAMDNIGIFAGAIDQWQGFVVLGSGNGVDRDKNGKVDPLMGGSEGEVTLRLAPRHSGLETAKHAVVLIASPSSSDATMPLALTILVAQPPELVAPGPTSVAFSRAFVEIPHEVNLDQETRTLSFPYAPADVSFRRVDFGDSRDPKWYVYFPTTTLKVNIPSVPPAFEDRFETVRPGTSAHTSAYLQSVSISKVTYDAMLTFDGRDMDNMVVATDGLSTREIVRTSSVP